jgi:hypothetical protein
MTREISFPKVPDPKKVRTGALGEGRLAGEPFGPRKIFEADGRNTLPVPPKEPVFTAQGATEAPDGGEIISAEGKTPAEARANLEKILTEKVMSGQATSATILGTAHYSSLEILPLDKDKLLKAQDDALQLAKATRATERFLEKHPEYVKDDRNRDAMIAYLRGGSFQWNETSLEIAYSELQHSGRYVTQAQVEAERAQAQQAKAEEARLQAEEAAMRPRGRFSAASQPHIPTAEEVRQKEENDLRQADDTIIREAEDLVSRSPQQYKQYLTHKTDWAQKLEAAYQRRAARRLG